MDALPKIEGAGVELIHPDTPLRLEDALKIAFPFGGMTIAGLRREIARGNLDVEMIAGKHFTTLTDIKRMRERCRVKAREHDSGNDRPGRGDVNPSGLSETEKASLAQESLLNLVRSDPPRKQKRR